MQVWRTQVEIPHQLGGFSFALRLRGLRPDITLETLDQVLAGVAGKWRTKVDAGKVGAHGRLRSKCAEVNFSTMEAADEARHVLEARPDVSVNPKGLAMRVVQL